MQFMYRGLSTDWVDLNLCTGPRSCRLWAQFISATAAYQDEFHIVVVACRRSMWHAVIGEET